MLRQILRIDLALVSSVNKFNKTGNTVQIEFLPCRNWIPLQFTSGSVDFLEKTKKTDAGISFEQKIKMEIPCERITTDTILRYCHRHLLICFTYNTGESEIIGTPDFPVNLETDLSVKQSSYYKLEFNCNTIYKAMRLIN